MLTRPCASRKSRSLVAIPVIAVAVIALLVFFLPTVIFASETVILNITLNQEGKGEFFVNFADDGDFQVKEADLRQMGFRGPFTHVINIAGESHVSLKSIPGLTFSYNDKTLSLDIMAPPEQLPARIIDFTPPQPLKVYYPKDTSAFLNYRLDYASGDSFGFKNFAMTNELGARYGDLLFLTDTSYQNDSKDDRFVRLMSSLVYDRRPDLQRFTLGDITASSGELGASVIMGGIGLSKLYRMNPNFIFHPTLSFSGLATLPSEAEIYLDGMRIRTERISPGGFELKNIDGYGGASLVEVVLKDPFGREQRIRAPFYFTDALLKAGLHEYSYNLGALRENFGISSSNYGKLAFSGFHWYGLTNAMTIGFRAEGAGSVFNLGPQASFLIHQAGTVTLSLAGSSDSGRGGSSGLFAYSYQGKELNGRLLFRGFSRDYATIATTAPDKKAQYLANAGLGYSTRQLGSLSVNFTSSKLYDGERFQTLSTTYTRSLFGKINLFATYRRIMDPRSGDEISVGLNYYPGNDINVSAGYQYTSDVSTETIQVQKNLPVGEGPGFNFAMERADSRNYGSINRFAPSLQYNSRYGTYAAEYALQNSSNGTTDASRLSAGGAISYVGSTVGLTRPVTDSFALVKVGEIEGVRVYQNNQEIGKTDAAGTVFVPNLSSFYYNQVSINDTDVPMDYQLTRKLVFTSPPYRSGSCVVFETARLQAITGILEAQLDGKVKPLVFHEVTLDIDGKTIPLQTGAGGEFYLDNYSMNEKASSDREEMGCQALGKSASTIIKPGKYRGSVSHKGQPYPFTITIPDSTDPIIDLGTITCELPPQGAPPPPVENGKPVQREKTSALPPETMPATPQQIVMTEKGPRPVTPPVGADTAARKDGPPATPAIPLGETGTAAAPIPPSAAPAEQRQTALPSLPSATSGLPPAQESAPGIDTSGPGQPGNRGVVVPAEEPMSAPSTPSGETGPAPATIQPAPLPSAAKWEPLDLEVYFEFDTDRFSSGQDRAVMLTAARILTLMSGLQARIEGHTDQLGTDRYNLRLGEKRGNKIVKELRRDGVDGKKIAKVTSFGKRKPKCPTLDEDCRQHNRRGVIHLIQK